MTAPPLEGTREAPAYAAEVRRWLDDLPADVVDELAGGLDADLADLEAESELPLHDRVGPPEGYAAELRSAAGLEPRPVARVRRGPWAAAGSAARRVTEHRYWSAAGRVLRDLAPVWWVVRAWVLVWVVAMRSGDVLPSDLSTWVALLALVALSVALGRGWRAGSSWVRGGVVVVDVVTAVLLLPVLVVIDSSPQRNVYVEQIPAPPGLSSDGRPVTNVFPYGPDGYPLQGVTLLDQDGEPIDVGTVDPMAPGGSDVRVQVPAVTVDGVVRHNVFPQGIVEVPGEEYIGWLSPDQVEQLAEQDDVQDSAPPRLQVPASQPVGPTVSADPVGPSEIP